MDLKLTGRRALVTGASKGIGFAAALMLAEEGCDVILVSRTPEALAEARAKIAGRAQVNVTVLPADLSQGDETRRVAAAAGEIDILVNNAGAIPSGRIDEIDEPRWREAWDLKLFGYINLTRAVYAGMAARRRGVIVNIIGGAGERPSAAYLAGAGANAALIAMTKALGAAAPKDGVRVVGINPGPTATDRLVTQTRYRAEKTLGDPDRWQELTASLPFGRPGTPEEIAAAVAFLASDLSAYTTGTVLTIDGGLAARPSP